MANEQQMVDILSSISIAINSIYDLMQRQEDRNRGNNQAGTPSGAGAAGRSSWMNAPWMHPFMGGLAGRLGGYGGPQSQQQGMGPSPSVPYGHGSSMGSMFNMMGGMNIPPGMLFQRLAEVLNNLDKTLRGGGAGGAGKAYAQAASFDSNPYGSSSGEKTAFEKLVNMALGDPEKGTGPDYMRLGRTLGPTARIRGWFNQRSGDDMQHHNRAVGNVLGQAQNFFGMAEGGGYNGDMSTGRVLGSMASAAGSLMSVFGGAIGALGGPLGKVAQVAMSVVDGLGRMGNALHAANMRLAEYSPSMAMVEAQSEVYEIESTYRKGEARAGSAERLSRGRAAADKAWEPFTNFMADSGNNVLSAFEYSRGWVGHTALRSSGSFWGTAAFYILGTAIAGPAGALTVGLTGKGAFDYFSGNKYDDLSESPDSPGGVKVSATAWTADIAMHHWSDNYGRPDHWFKD